MPKALNIETLLQNGSTEWNKLRKAGKVPLEHTGATLANLFSANADLSGLGLIGTEWEKCDLSKVSFKESDLSNAYFHGGRLQDCDFRGANLEGATFERMKVLRCDFSGAKGIEELELEEVDLDRVIGLGDESMPPPPPPPVVGATSFTREQRTAAEGLVQPSEGELPPFRPQDTPGTLLFRALKKLGNLPVWVLDVPGLRPPLPGRVTVGASLESLLREAVKSRCENHRPSGDQQAIDKAQQALRLGGKDAAFAAMFLRELGVEPLFRFSAAKSLKAALREELDIDDLTGPIDPRVAGALRELKLPFEVVDHIGEVRRRLAATQLFTALLEAGFTPENNWEEALDSSEPAAELATVAVGDDRASLGEAFRSFASLPDEARLRRLAYLAEATTHLEALSRLPNGVEPMWLHGPETRECHEREMQLVQVLNAEDIPQKVPELGKTELGIEPGSVPEDSTDDLFVHMRCTVCGQEKLLVQSP